jgi:hypothetical protein
MIQSWCEPPSSYKFPVKQGINRESAFLALRWLARSKKAGSTKGFPQIPYPTEQGYYSSNREFFGGTGNFQGGAGNLSKPAFFAVERSLSRRKETVPLGDWQEKG